MKKFVTALSVIATCASLPALAGHHEKGDMADKMGKMCDAMAKEMDKDGDALVTREEHAAFFDAKFTETDTDKDGKISADERKAMREKHMKDMHESKEEAAEEEAEKKAN